MRQIMMIPDRKRMSDCIGLMNEYNLGFEYNDFFIPEILDSEVKMDKIITEYGNYDRPAYNTVHGAFYDVIPSSMDAKIREISDLRIRQSLNAARKMSAHAVIFHTNYNPFLNSKQYIEGWIKQNAEYWSGLLEEYPDVSIYLENMFDTTPDILGELSGRLCRYPNYGVCLDYAHAAITKTDPAEWARELGKFVKHVHINDNDMVSDLHLAWGDGTIDREGFYKSYEQYLGDVSVLIETSSIEKINRSLVLLKKEGFI